MSHSHSADFGYSNQSPTTIRGLCTTGCSIWGSISFLLRFVPLSCLRYCLQCSCKRSILWNICIVNFYTLFHVSDIFQRVILIMLLSSFTFSSRAIVLQSLLKLSRVFLSFFSLKSAMSLQTKTTSFFWRATSKRSSQALEDSTSSSTSFFCLLTY